MNGALLRIAIRYAVGALVARGFLSSDLGGSLSTDPDVEAAIQVGIAAAIGVAVEGWYWLAKRLGWAT